MYIDFKLYADRESLYEYMYKRFEPFAKSFVRSITDEDLQKLTQIPMIRITRFDSDKADDVIAKLEAEMERIKHDLAHIIDFAIAFFTTLKEKYGKGRERQTELRSFDTIEATKVALRNTKLFVNREEGAGEVDKQIIQDEIRKFLVGKTSNDNEKNNPFAINLYLLGYDSNKKLSTLNRAIKENLKTYLNEYKILTDGININDGFIINIGLEFEIVTLRNYNKSEVLSECISELKEYFDIDSFTFNNTINISELELIIANVDGVSSVPKLKIVNKCGGQYAPNTYNIEAAIKDKVLYPSLDPSVFEIKFPDSDIKGRAK